MTFKKVFALLTAILLGLVGCAGIGPNTAHNMATTSFHYDLSYNTYMVEINGEEIAGGGINVASIKIGPQTVTWEDARTGELHTAKNQLIIVKEQLKGKKYLALHIYPDDTVEVMTSNDLPDATAKGTALLKQQRSLRVKEAINNVN